MATNRVQGPILATLLTFLIVVANHEVFVEGGPGQAGDGGPGVVEYRDPDPTHLKQEFVPIFSVFMRFAQFQRTQKKDWKN